MKNRLAVALCVAMLGIAAVTVTTPAQARVSVGIGIGGGYYGGYPCCGYYPYYSPYYYGYPAYYAAPPTVVYAQPVAPPVTYVQPAPQQTQQPVQVEPAGQASAPYTDKQGRTCRTIQSSIDGTPVNGTACQTSDGSWHTVD